ncbi:GrpB family protein [Isoptericola jiangsuensis]|uniref:GrpB family protein n=1 Tax=Isoptericola jiangsuensis TaxID=548579 RepID=UPI003AAE3CBA
MTHRPSTDHGNVTASQVFGRTGRRRVVLVPYNSEWPRAFERVRDEITCALGEVALDVHHIGSTSVPGLLAKAVIDVVLVVVDVDAESAYLDRLVGCGYNFRRREPGHRLFRSPDLDVNIHVLQAGDPAIAAHLVFRDHLRRDSTDRERYGRLKTELARREWDGMNAYADAKSEFIQEVLTRHGATVEGKGTQ